MPAHAGPRQLTARASLNLAAPGGAHCALPGPVRHGAIRAHPTVLPPMIGAGKAEVRARVERLVVQFLCDDSSSMYGQSGDDYGMRYAAALSILRLMRRAGGGRAGVVHWGSTAPAELAVAPVDITRGLGALKGALTIPATLGGTNLVAGLTLARRLMPDPVPGETPLVFVLSDGVEPVKSEMNTAIAAFPPGCVHMLLVDPSRGCDPSMERAWETVAFGSFHRLDVFDTKAMAYQLADVLAASLGLAMPARTMQTTRRRGAS